MGTFHVSLVLAQHNVFKIFKHANLIYNKVYK